MKDYIGVKHIKARPMTDDEFWIYNGNDSKITEPTDGYLVEYMNGGKSNHPDHEGYISWSPKDLFEKAYHEIHNHADPDLLIMDMLHTLKEGDS